MSKPILMVLFAFALVSGVSAVHADKVILKSGEMFQTRKAWKKDNRVYLYRDGQVIHVDQRDVERVIHEPTPQNRLPAGSEPADTPALPEERSPSGVTPSAAPPIGDDTGYRGLRWGMPPQTESLDQVGFDPAYGGVQQYVQTEGGRRFGRARVDRIVLGFWQGGLYTIVVEVSNFLDFRDLKAEALRRFGKGVKNQVDVEKTYWVDAAADRLLAYDADTDTGYLWMRSRTLHGRVRERYPD